MALSDLQPFELCEKLKGDKSHIALWRKLPEYEHALVSAFICICHLSIEDSGLTVKKKKSKSKDISSTPTPESLVADAVNNFMNERLMSDIPSFVIQELKAYISKIVHNSVNPISNKEFSSLQHDVAAMNEEVKTSMTTSFKKGGHTMTKSTHGVINHNASDSSN